MKRPCGRPTKEDIVRDLEASRVAKEVCGEHLYSILMERASQTDITSDMPRRTRREKPST